jgi:hypothetical protein
VNHEEQDAAVVDRAELRRAHAEIDRVMRQEVPGRCLENGEHAAPDEKDRRQDEERHRALSI